MTSMRKIHFIAGKRVKSKRKAERGRAEAREEREGE